MGPHRFPPHSATERRPVRAYLRPRVQTPLLDKGRCAGDLGGESPSAMKAPSPSHPPTLHPPAVQPRPSRTLTFLCALHVDPSPSPSLPSTSLKFGASPPPLASYNLCLAVQLPSSTSLQPPVSLATLRSLPPRTPLIQVSTNSSRRSTLRPPRLNKHDKTSAARAATRFPQTGECSAVMPRHIPIVIAPCAVPQRASASPSGGHPTRCIHYSAPFQLPTPLAAPSRYLSPSQQHRVAPSPPPFLPQPNHNGNAAAFATSLDRYASSSPLTLAPFPNPALNSTSTRPRSRDLKHSSRPTQPACLNNEHCWLSPTTPSPRLALPSAPRTHALPLESYYEPIEPYPSSAASPDTQMEQTLYQDAVLLMQPLVESLEPRALQAIYQLAADRLRVWLATTLPTEHMLDTDDTAAANNAARQLALRALVRLLAFRPCRPRAYIRAASSPVTNVPALFPQATRVQPHWRGVIHTHRRRLRQPRPARPSSVLHRTVLLQPAFPVPRRARRPDRFTHTR